MSRHLARSLLSYGTTLVELTIAVAMMAVVFAAIVPIVRAIRTNWDRRQQSADQIQNTRVFFDHIHRNLITATRIVGVSQPDQTQGYIEYQASDGKTYRYELTGGNVRYGEVGSLQDLAGPLSQLRFACFSPQDLQTPITDGSQIGLVQIAIAADGDRPVWSTSVQLRTIRLQQEQALVGWWRFDEEGGLTALDSSWYGNHATLKNMTGSERTTGIINKALWFDGSNDYASAPPVVRDSFSIVFWVRFEQPGPTGNDPWYDGKSLVDAYVEGGTRHFGISLVHKRIAFGVGSTTIRSKNNLDENKWYHVVATRDGQGKITLYIDGQREAQGDGPAGLLTDFSEIRFGGSPGRYFKGRLDEIRIYNYVITQATITDLFAIGDMVQHLPLDEISGSTAYDNINNNNGSLRNGPVWTAGNWSGALSFDGTNDYVSSPMTIEYHMTIAAWIKTSSPALGRFGNPSQWWDGEGIVDADKRGNNNDFGCSNNRGYFVFGTGDRWGRQDKSIISKTKINDGTWHHVVATRNGWTGQMKIYVDGNLEATGYGYTGRLDAASQIMRIGGILDEGGDPNPDRDRMFEGLIDDVRIYRQVLTDSQIRLLLQ